MVVDYRNHPFAPGLPPGRNPGVELGANLQSISHRCNLFKVAFVWELTKETIRLPLGCLQGGSALPGRGRQRVGLAPCQQQPRFYMKRELKGNLSAEEVYETNSSILIDKNMLSSKRHCQKGFDLILFS